MNPFVENVQLSGIVAIRDMLLKMDKPLRLESGEPAFETPEHIKEAAIKALRDNQTHYVNSQGIVPFREAIVQKLYKENDVTASVDEVIAVNGGMHGLYVTMQALCQSGDEVLIPTPNWTAVQWIITLAGATPVHVPVSEKDEFRFDIAELEKQVSPKTKAIIINSPHNPTGGMLQSKDIYALLDFAQRHNIFVITDEAYEHIVYDGHSHYTPLSFINDFPEMKEKIIGVFTFSKSYAMTGWRLGYIVTHNKALMQSLKKLVLYSANGINSITQWAGKAALEGPQGFILNMRDTFQKNRDILFEGIAGCKYLHASFKPKGAFYLFPSLKKEWLGEYHSDPEKAFSEHIINAGTLGSTPGIFFGPGGTGYIRFSYACATDMVVQAADVLKRI
jgi:aspartate aminotransferase